MRIGWISGSASAMRHLQLMGRPPTINHGEPPIINVRSDGIRWPTSKGDQQDWVMESIQWGTNVMKREWFRQDAVVNLIEYIDEDRVAFRNIDLPSISPQEEEASPSPPSHQHHKKTQHGWPKWYSVMPGDTLPKIAAKFYHDSSMWPRIARANHIRDPRSIHFPMILLIPAP
jgi:LysM repeat protein